MERYTQKQLRALIASGAAIDLEKAHKEAEKAGLTRIEGLTKIGFSHGVYGINGALFKDSNGRLYAITQRTCTLFCYA